MRTFSSPLLALLFPTLALAACSSSSSGAGASLSGNVGGTTFTVASQIGISGAAETTTGCSSISDGGQACTTTSVGQAYIVILTNRADATCELLQGASVNKNFASFDTLTLTVGTSASTLTPGTYAIVTSNTATSGATATFNTTNASCASVISDVTATSGSVTISSASSSAVAGTFSVTFNTQGTFTGSFSTSICSVPDGGLNGGNGPCQQ